jgi:hypothetical protein
MVTYITSDIAFDGVTVGQASPSREQRLFHGSFAAVLLFFCAPVLAAQGGSLISDSTLVLPGLLGMALVFCMAMLLGMKAKGRRTSTTTSATDSAANPDKVDWERSVTIGPLTQPEKNATSRTDPIDRSGSAILRQSFANSAWQRDPAAEFYNAIEYEAVPLPSHEEEDAPYPGSAPMLYAIEVSEQLDPLPQAQFWAAIGKPSVAIEILEPIYQQEPTPHSWLLLLEMYSLTEQRQAWEAAQQCFKKVFNCKVPPWDVAPEHARAQTTLRDMPGLMQRINRALPGNGVMAFLRNLLRDDRQGSRAGFEYGVYCDLLRLHDALCDGKPVACCEELFA